MNTSLSTNLLTGCPAQTCLLAGHAPNYGKGLANLPPRIRSRKSTAKTQASRCITASTIDNSSRTPSSSDDENENSPRKRFSSKDVSLENVFKKGNRSKGSKVTLSPLLLSPYSSKSSFPAGPNPSRIQPDCGSGDGVRSSESTSSPSFHSSPETYTFRQNNGSEKVRCVALPLLKQRLGYLWEKRMFTDVVFLVGRNKTKIEAHRIILASASEIFQSLLFNEGKPLLSDGKFLLYEDDFSEPAFEVFIKAMYTNEIPICLTLPLALEVFYATKKYSVIFLEDQVLEHIRQLLTVSNVFEALRFSTNALELTYLAPICWKIIEERTGEVLEYHMDDLDAHTFARILERDRLNMEEVEIFQTAVRWAANTCKTHGMKTTGKNKRQFMEPLIKHFRFTTMTPSQFTDVVVPSRILEPKEIQQIQGVFNKVIDSKTPLPFKIIPRVNTSQIALKEEAEHSLSYQNCSSLDRVKEVPKICSDSAVIAPKHETRVHSRKTSTVKLKPKRVITAKSRT